MAKPQPERKRQKGDLPAEYITVDTPPPRDPGQFPVRGGQRAPDQAEQLANGGQLKGD